MAESIESRAEQARRYVAEQLLEVRHTLGGEEAPIEAYLQGLVDMAVHLGDGGQSITDLARLVIRERLGSLTGEIETGILHIRPVDPDLDRWNPNYPRRPLGGREGDAI